MRPWGHGDLHTGHWLLMDPVRRICPSWCTHLITSHHTAAGRFMSRRNHYFVLEIYSLFTIIYELSGFQLIQFSTARWGKRKWLFQVAGFSQHFNIIIELMQDIFYSASAVVFLFDDFRTLVLSRTHTLFMVEAYNKRTWLRRLLLRQPEKNYHRSTADHSLSEC